LGRRDVVARRGPFFTHTNEVNFSPALCVAHGAITSFYTYDSNAYGNGNGNGNGNGYGGVYGDSVNVNVDVNVDVLVPGTGPVGTAIQQYRHQVDNIDKIVNYDDSPFNNPNCISIKNCTSVTFVTYGYNSSVVSSRIITLWS